MGEKPAWSFEGQYFVVTGGSQGIGGAAAELMAERGAAGIAICGRDQDKLDSMAAKLKDKGCETVAISADLQHVDACFRVIDLAAETFGQLNGLVNAAGFTERGTIDDTSSELWDMQFHVNARAPFFLIQRILPHLRRAGGGTIVNVQSIVAHGGPPFIAAYCSAKGALSVLTKNVANAVAKDRVRVNGLNMGWTATPNEHVIQTRFHDRPENWLDEVDAQQPFGRLLRPLDVGRAIAFLASDDSGLMTGSIVDFEQHIIGGFPQAEI
ncbi:MAG: SDR family oxidoreductase [Geminicoccaceae bacterium]